MSEGHLSNKFECWIVILCLKVICCKNVMDFGHSLGKSVVFPVHVKKHQVKPPNPEIATLNQLYEKQYVISGFWCQVRDVFWVS